MMFRASREKGAGICDQLCQRGGRGCPKSDIIQFQKFLKIWPFFTLGTGQINSAMTPKTIFSETLTYIFATMHHC